MINYRTYDDLFLAIKGGMDKVPADVDLVVGIPRSGMIPAYMIASLRNIKAVSLDSFLEGRIDGSGQRTLGRDIKTPDEARRILIVDDSIIEGSAIAKARCRVAASRYADAGNIIYGAVYCLLRNADLVDVAFEHCPVPRIFEWNILSSWFLENACVDIDGVLCHDPSPEQNDDGERYLDFIAAARPLFVPRVRVSCLVTSRLEKYRPQTEKWLAENGINYGELVMLDLPSKEERIRQGAHGRFKAAVFAGRQEKYFIESEWGQATEIAEVTGKTVFCTAVMDFASGASRAASARPVARALAKVIPGRVARPVGHMVSIVRSALAKRIRKARQIMKI